MSQDQIRTSHGHVGCYSHGHDLVPCRVAVAAAAAAASLTSPVLRGHLAARPSVGARGDPVRALGLG